MAMDRLAGIVESIHASLYAKHEMEARLQISAGDESNWPIVGAALLLNCPVWTDDRDFFGSGVATWTTASVEVFLGE
jgi:predicted nucleic acid-binding protein